ncbi:MAG: hypothetical protein A2Z21_03610 [Candidatus Fraserbacteria bacterium RBG_16_55_9]|uniref:MalT-like TPR region domain-containing protein n=1 Tax=Fraserbacteria sp. (strain RBG_16_55_9) TaxID=1817864 RepID=A0A1F5UZ60_FRAXR|nr:MAG: hypothetical protein A2Z21_03610 [Candidatus Fraserbacteria bacterium RBG_16_55_9]
MRQRDRNDYIKSLYHSGHGYYKLITNDWKEEVYALERSGVTPENEISYNAKDLENAESAWKYFYQCWLKDGLDRADLSEPSSNSTPSNGIFEGVHRLYWLGKVSFVHYWILSGHGQKDTAEAIKNRNKAEKYLVAALELAWSPKSKSQKKDFIAELLVRLYISKGEYDKAIEIINKHRGRYLEPYISHTLALALSLSGKYAEAQDVLDEALQSRGNKEIWMTHFLKSCAYSREGHHDKANESLNKANEEAQKAGRKGFNIQRFSD